jgi:hypothetical protein
MGNGNKVFRKMMGLEFGKRGAFRISSGIGKRRDWFLWKSRPQPKRKRKGAGAGFIESPFPQRQKEREDRIRVSLGTSVLKEGADVAGGEQTTGRKETPKQKKDVASTDLERRKR